MAGINKMYIADNLQHTAILFIVFFHVTKSNSCCTSSIMYIDFQFETTTWPYPKRSSSKRYQAWCTEQNKKLSFQILKSCRTQTAFKIIFPSYTYFTTHFPLTHTHQLTFILNPTHTTHHPRSRTPPLLPLSGKNPDALDCFSHTQ